MTTVRTRPMPTTRDRILDAAERLLARFGYKKTTMEDIAREAGLGKRTLYLHFASKEAVALATIDRIVDRLTGQLRAVAAAVGPPGEPPRGKLLRRAPVRLCSGRHYRAQPGRTVRVAAAGVHGAAGAVLRRRGPGGCRPPGRRPAARGLRLRGPGNDRAHPAPGDQLALALQSHRPGTGQARGSEAKGAADRRPAPWR